MINKRFKYAFGTTLVTSSLLLMSHGHAFAATNNTDNAFNHDNDGQPVTTQDSNNNVDASYNHDVDDNNDTDAGYNHDVNSNVDTASDDSDNVDPGYNNDVDDSNDTDAGYNHDDIISEDTNADGVYNDTLDEPGTFPSIDDIHYGFGETTDENGNIIYLENAEQQNTAPVMATQQDSAKHQAENNDMGFNGYAEQQGLVKNQPANNSQQDPDKYQAENNDMGFNGYVEKHDLIKQQAQSSNLQTNTPLSTQAKHDEQMNHTSSHHELPVTGERTSTTPLVISILSFILGVGVMSLRRIMSKKQ
ncbi:hypothetical protein HYI43_01445 [Staphylococcus taiwanensis]|nr:hypothetical protein HYI43_01445 [Staphylococcus taiwanensis]